MKKYLIALPVILLLVTFVLATTSMMSIRGMGGEVVDIKGDSDLTAQKIKFSYWEKTDGELTQGMGGLQVTAKDEVGKRVVLIVSFDASGEGTATYYKQGMSPERFETTVNVEYDGTSTDVRGTGDISFEVFYISTWEV